jgi:hypothetical protein
MGRPHTRQGLLVTIASGTRGHHPRRRGSPPRILRRRGSPNSDPRRRGSPPCILCRRGSPTSDPRRRGSPPRIPRSSALRSAQGRSSASPPASRGARQAPPGDGLEEPRPQRRVAAPVSEGARGERRGRGGAALEEESIRRRRRPCPCPSPRPVRLAYQPPASSSFLSEQTSHQ